MRAFYRSCAASRATREELVSVISRIPNIDAVILGGTELPLLLTEPSYRGVAMLDTMAVHADAAVDALLTSLP